MNTVMQARSPTYRPEALSISLRCMTDRALVTTAQRLPCTRGHDKNKTMGGVDTEIGKACTICTPFALCCVICSYGLQPERARLLLPPHLKAISNLPTMRLMRCDQSLFCFERLLLASTIAC